MARIYRFDFKRLDVYQAAVAYFAWTVQMVSQLPWRFKRLSDQMLGAALSMVGNLGESGGRTRKPREASQHFRYAQGSAHESAAYLDALAAVGLLSDEEYNQKEAELADIGAMLTRLIQYQEGLIGRPRKR